MINNIIKKIPAKSLGYILICGGILFVVIMGILQFYRYNSNRFLAVKKVQNQIDEQKELRPVYLAILKDMDNKQVYMLPNPVKTKLSRKETDKFQDVFRAVATKSGMKIIYFVPDVNNAANSSQNMPYNVTVKGELTNLRQLLIGLGAVPYIDKIDEMHIKQHSDSMEFKLKIWIALDN